MVTTRPELGKCIVGLIEDLSTLLCFKDNINFVLGCESLLRCYGEYGVNLDIVYGTVEYPMMQWPELACYWAGRHNDMIPSFTSMY
jgi:hypothetical protein